MKIWKSPVVYLGLVLIVSVLALLAAPLVVDWNRYRGELEAFGQDFTGRKVMIEGPISARLFPWPRLAAENVHIANPPGFEHRKFASAERVSIRMSLAGLLQGTYNVEGIDIERPEIRFERFEDGSVNWLLSPSEGVLKGETLSRIRLDRISLRDGTVRLVDGRRASPIVLESVSGSLDAPAIAGPWRLRARSDFSGTVYDIGFNTGIQRAGQPFRFGLRLSAADGSGFVYGFDGDYGGGRIKGSVRVEPSQGVDGRVDAEGQVRPLAFRSTVTGDFEQLSFDKIEISSPGMKTGGGIISGSGKLSLGETITAAVDLSTATFDMDEYAGAGARKLLREGGGLAVADGLFGLVPKDMTIRGTARVTSLKAGGETLDNVILTFDAAADALRIQELSASLPGRSRALFNGVFFPGKTGSELGGSLAIESGDLRQLALWVWPEARDRIAGMWTGSRGRLKLQTDISLTPDRYRLSKASYELDGEAGSAQISVAKGGRGSVDIRLDAGRIDIDSFMPGKGVFSSQPEGFSDMLAYVLPHADARDLRFTLQAREIVLNGVSAGDVAIDVASGANGLDVRTLDIGSVEGARLSATGLVLNGGAGPDGSIDIAVTAPSPRGLLRLAGAVTGNSDPAWVLALGETDIKGKLSFKTADRNPTMTFDTNGSSGPYDIAASGELRGQSGLSGMELGGSIEIASDTSANMARLFGLLPVVEDSLPAKLVLTGAGKLAERMQLDLAVQAYGGHFNSNGTIDAKPAGWEFDGNVAIRATDAMPLFDAMGVPVSADGAQVLVIDGKAVSRDGKLGFDGFSGRLGQGPVSGSLEFSWPLNVKGEIATGPIVLGNFLAAAFVSWTGQPADAESGLASTLPLGISGEVWLKPESIRIHDRFTAREAQIGIIANGGEVSIAMFGKSEDGRDAQIEIASRGGDQVRTIKGRISVPVDLESQIRLAGGRPVAKGSGMIDVGFQGEGRTPGGALASLAGSGSYSFDGLGLYGLSPSEFSRLAAAATDSAGITAAFDALRGGALEIGKASGAITIVNGEAAILPFAVSGPDADVLVKVTGQLATGEMAADIVVKPKVRDGLPAMSIAYAGPPLALARSEDNAELATKLGVAIMEQGVEELERLQREQERMTAEEEKMRKEDEEKLLAYYAQRDELLLRRRELKVHGDLRKLKKERLREKLAADEALYAAINKGELKLRLRELRVWRRIAKLAPGEPQEAGEAQVEKPPAAKKAEPAPSPSQ